MKQTIAFISPPSLFLLDERVFPALGILKVAASAEQLGYPVEHIDLTGVTNYEDAVRDHCSRSPANIFAMTATTPQMVAATKILRVLRESAPTAKVILGGPHPTLVHAAFKKTSSSRAKRQMTQLLHDYDVIVAGDGEDAIETAIHTKLKVIDADNPKGDLFMSKERVAEAPLPARHLIDLESYHYTIDGVQATPLVDQLGCPFGCNFCAGRSSPMLRRARMRPVKSVIDEMRMLYEQYGYRGFMFFSDELNVNTKVTELLQAICGLGDELGVQFLCRGFIKAELFTEEQALWMREAGFRQILCGFESGSPRILKNINKQATVEDNNRVMELSAKYGLGVKALMSIGHPGESPETVRDTEEWLLKAGVQDFDVTIITPYPGSPYHDQAVQLKVPPSTWMFTVNGDRLFMWDIDYTQVEDFYKGAIGNYQSYVFTDSLTSEDLVTLRDDVERNVRTKLGIPFPKAEKGMQFETSMGALPGSVYRRSS
jgi:anaerobic magnesium-protoporphyrin IX monomethyl ester cyclase